MIIGITGTLGAGKGTIVEILKEKGFEHYSVRNFLIEEIKKRNLIINRDSMVLVANELRKKNSPSYIVEQLYKKASAKKGNYIIESLRTIGEVESLRKKENFYLFSVDANPFLRYERISKRNTETDKINFETFKLNEEREWNNDNLTKGNLKKCIELADFKFENNETIFELRKKVLQVLEKISFEKTKKRKDYISWDEYFMGVAILSAGRSKDPSTQVGACIVDEDNKIVGTGYNGATKGFDDDKFPWEREGSFLNTKYAFVCHAELNAILNATKESLKNCTIYVALFPCNECAKAIVQSGIKKVVYMSDKYKDTDSSIASRKILKMANVELVKFNSNINKIELNFKKGKQ